MSEKSKIEGMGGMVVCDRYNGPPIKQPEIACAKRYRMLQVVRDAPERAPRTLVTGPNAYSHASRLEVCLECPHAEERLAKFDRDRIDKIIQLRPARRGRTRANMAKAEPLRKRLVSLLEEHGPMTPTQMRKELASEKGMLRNFSNIMCALRFLRAMRIVQSVQRERASKGVVYWFMTGDERAHHLMYSGVPNELLDGARWKEIPGRRGKHLVSDQGQVWSSNNRKLLNPYVNVYGYAHVGTTLDNERTKTYVHNLVWTVFVGPIEPGKVVAHKNGDKTDNRLENLEVMTRTERTARFRGRGKMTPDKVRSIRRKHAQREKGSGLADLAKAYGMSRRQVRAIINREAWRDIA